MVIRLVSWEMNDATAMKSSDIAISVDNAVNIAKESADIILLEKDLMVLEQGIIEGRKTYANMIKYIKITAFSNFGNMFSVLIASALLNGLLYSELTDIHLQTIYISLFQTGWFLESMWSQILILQMLLKNKYIKLFGKKIFCFQIII